MVDRVRIMRSLIDEQRRVEDSLKNSFIFDLSKIPCEELKKQYINYRFLSDNDLFGSPLMKNMETNNYITENDGYCEPLNKVMDIITKKYNLKDWQFEIIEHANNIEVALLISDIDMNMEIIKNDMNQLGYFCSKVNKYEFLGMEWASMQFEPLYQNDVNSIVHNFKVLFHISPIENLESIKTKGFIPQHNNKRFNYPPRVYFVKGNVTRDDLYNMTKQLADTNNKYGKYNIYTIEVSRINDNVKFYFDPNYEYGVFTEEPIPYYTVISVSEIEISE
jgi:hypothetical protein